MMSILPEFGNAILTLIAFVVALSIIVGVHEYGHYIVGRWSGIKAEVFSIGFGPVLWSRVDRFGTRWQFAAIPFGGYVKFLGDANAASGKDGEAMEELPEEELRHTMHGAPLWARSATVFAGPLFNFILSILVFGAVMMAQGKVAEPLTVGEMKPLPVTGSALQPGDELLSVAGVPVPEFDGEGFQDFVDTLPTEPLLEYGIRRADADAQVPGPYPMP